MKFDHNFTQTTATPTGRTYAADGWQAQLDFLSGSCLRVALYRNADDLLPTFNIDPDNASIGPQGRARLSTVGFQPTAPTVTENDSGTAFALRGNGRAGSPQSAAHLQDRRSGALCGSRAAGL